MSVWQSKTINNNVDFLYFDPNGNLVLFGKDESIIWAAGIGLYATKLIMQDDGNLVLHKDALPIHIIQDDKLVFHKNDAVILWSTDANNT